MASWREGFDELSVVEREEIRRWKGGANNDSQIRTAMEAIMEHLRQYEAAGSPARDAEMRSS